MLGDEGGVGEQSYNKKRKHFVSYPSTTIRLPLTITMGVVNRLT